MEQIKDVLSDVLKKLEKNRAQKDYTHDIWQKCVTKKISQHTKIYSLRDHKLYINVENPAWRQEINIQKEIIIEKLKKITNNKVNDIRLKVGDIHDNRE